MTYDDDACPHDDDAGPYEDTLPYEVASKYGLDETLINLGRLLRRHYEARLSKRDYHYSTYLLTHETTLIA